jgi:hypothetical protein
MQNMPSGKRPCMSSSSHHSSVARKIGCCIFLLWEDIVEVQPKMILTFIGTLMSVASPKLGDLKKKDKTRSFERRTFSFRRASEEKKDIVELRAGAPLGTNTAGRRVSLGGSKQTLGTLQLSAVDSPGNSGSGVARRQSMTNIAALHRHGEGKENVKLESPRKSNGKTDQDATLDDSLLSPPGSPGSCAREGSGEELDSPSKKKKTKQIILQGIKNIFDKK